MATTLLETAKKYIEHFAALDTQLLESVLAENHTHQFAPASLNLYGPFDKQGMLEHNEDLRSILTGFPVTAKEYIVSEGSNQVTVWATSQTHFRNDVKDEGIATDEWVYEGEYIFLFSMDKTGEKITRTIEFLDSKKTVEQLLGLMNRAKKNREKRLASKVT